MRLSELTPVDAAFREELRDWLADHLVGEFHAARGLGGPADDTAWDVRLAWEKELAAARWLNVSWPEEYGGRGGTTTQELIFHIEHAAAEAPYWVGVQGRDLFGPTLLEFGTEAAEAALPPADHPLRGDVGAGLQRARRRLGPRRPEDPCRARRRRVGHQRAEDLDDVRRPRRLALRAVPHQPGRAEAPRHLDAARAAPPGRRRRPADPQHGRRPRVLRGVLRRRPHRRSTTWSATSTAAGRS